MSKNAQETPEFLFLFCTNAHERVGKVAKRSLTKNLRYLLSRSFSRFQVVIGDCDLAKASAANAWRRSTIRAGAEEMLMTLQAQDGKKVRKGHSLNSFC